MPLLKAELLYVRKSPEKLRIYRCSHFQTVPVQQLNDLNDSNWLIGSCSKPDSHVLLVLVGILHVGLFAAGNKSHHRSSLPAYACKVELESLSQACKHLLFKKVGTPSGITNLCVKRRSEEYENQVSANPLIA